MGSLGETPKFHTLSTMLKGMKYLFQRPLQSRFVLSICAQQAYNSALNRSSNILENALAGADAFATFARARSKEYLLKHTHDF